MEIFTELQPHLVELLSTIGIIIAILTKSTKYTKSELLKQKQEKAHAKSLKCEKKLAKAYEKEKSLDEEAKKYAS